MFKLNFKKPVGKNERKEDIKRASEAARKLYTYGKIKPLFENDINHVVYDYASGRLHKAIQNISESKNKSAIRPIIDYLRYTPFESFTYDKTGYRVTERPKVYLIERMIDFLIIVSAKEAIPVLEQLSNIERNVMDYGPSDEIDTCDNSSEREHAREAIRILSKL